jgi:hypothetical protein
MLVEIQRGNLMELVVVITGLVLMAVAALIAVAIGLLWGMWRKHQKVSPKSFEMTSLQAANHKRMMDGRIADAAAFSKNDRMAMANHELACYKFGPDVKVVGSSGGWTTASFGDEFMAFVYIQKTDEAKSDGGIEEIVFRVRFCNEGNALKVSKVLCHPIHMCPEIRDHVASAAMMAKTSPQALPAFSAA